MVKKKKFSTTRNDGDMSSDQFNSKGDAENKPNLVYLREKMKEANSTQNNTKVANYKGKLASEKPLTTEFILQTACQQSIDQEKYWCILKHFMRK